MDMAYSALFKLFLMIWSNNLKHFAMLKYLDDYPLA